MLYGEKTVIPAGEGGMPSPTPHPMHWETPTRHPYSSQILTDYILLQSFYRCQFQRAERPQHDITFESVLKLYLVQLIWCYLYSSISYGFEFFCSFCFLLFLALVRISLDLILLTHLLCILQSH